MDANIIGHDCFYGIVKRVKSPVQKIYNAIKADSYPLRFSDNIIGSYFGATKAIHLDEVLMCDLNGIIYFGYLS